jgi:hypothetical protein
MVRHMIDSAREPVWPPGGAQHAGGLPLPQQYRLSSLAAFGEIFVVVIDTSVITSDVIKTVKGGLPSPKLLALRTGLVRGFMAHHTWAEVPRVLGKAGPGGGIRPGCGRAAVVALLRKRHPVRRDLGLAARRSCPGAGAWRT